MANQFIDCYLPDSVQGLPVQVGPRFSTRITLAKSGDEGRNRNWQHPLRKFQLPEAVVDQSSFEDAYAHWLVTGGPFSTFPFRDPIDFASAPLDEVNVPPETTGLDQEFGVGDGFTTQFQLTKTIEVGDTGFTYTRPIYLPITEGDGAVVVLMNGVAPGSVDGAHGGPYTATVEREGGMVSFFPPPQAGLVLTWGGLFDTNVRWEGDDTFDANIHSQDTNGALPINLVEVRWC